MMKWIKCLVIFLTLDIVILTSASSDPEVSCVFMESCVLPCSFRSGPDPVIHWFKTPDETPLHSYYRGQNQFNHQHENYRDRTSLFEEEISRGNASLLLTEVKVQDEGRYRCFTSTTRNSKQSYINLNVFAPVAEVELQQEEEELKCRSRDVYPKPEVSWTPSTEHHTTVETTENGLYSVVSSVRLPHSPPHEHSCNVSTLHNWRSATYRWNPGIHILGNYIIIPCTASKSPIKSLVWKFNLTEIIYNRTGSNSVCSESWRQFVDAVTESNRLVLINLTSDQQGLYSCVLRTDTETFVINTEINTGINTGINKGIREALFKWIIVTVGILFVFAVMVFIHARRLEHRRSQIESPLSEMSSDRPDSELTETRRLEEDRKIF